MAEPTKEPTELQKMSGRFPLYIRLGWGMILLFGMVGNCARPGTPIPIYVFIFVAIMWSCTRAMTEAIDAYRILMLAKAHDNEKKAAKKDDDKGAPPGPPAAT